MRRHRRAAALTMQARFERRLALQIGEHRVEHARIVAQRQAIGLKILLALVQRMEMRGARARVEHAVANHMAALANPAIVIQALGFVAIRARLGAVHRREHVLHLPVQAHVEARGLALDMRDQVGGKRGLRIARDRQRIHRLPERVGHLAEFQAVGRDRDHGRDAGRAYALDHFDERRMQQRLAADQLEHARAQHLRGLAQIGFDRCGARVPLGQQRRQRAAFRAGQVAVIDDMRFQRARLHAPVLDAVIAIQRRRKHVLPLAGARRIRDLVRIRTHISFLLPRNGKRNRSDGHARPPSRTPSSPRRSGATRNATDRRASLARSTA